MVKQIYGEVVSLCQGEVYGEVVLGSQRYKNIKAKRLDLNAVRNAIQSLVTRVNVLVTD